MIEEFVWLIDKEKLQIKIRNNYKTKILRTINQNKKSNNLRVLYFHLYFQMVSNWMNRIWAAKCLDANMITVQTHTEWWLNYGRKLVSFRIISSLLKSIQQLVFPKFVDFVEETYLTSQNKTSHWNTCILSDVDIIIFLSAKIHSFKLLNLFFE